MIDRVPSNFTFALLLFNSSHHLGLKFEFEILLKKQLDNIKVTSLY